jgi:hypothetical protein
MVDIRVTACQASRLSKNFDGILAKTFDSQAKLLSRTLHGTEGYQKTKHTAAGIPTWSPTVVLICRSTAYVWQSGRDAQFSADCGRMCCSSKIFGRWTNLKLLDGWLLKQQCLFPPCSTT